MNLFGDFAPATADEWVARIRQELKDKPLESITWTVEEGIDVQPFYNAQTTLLEALPVSAKCNNAWRLRQEVAWNGEDTGLKKANITLLEALEQGCDAPSLLLDHELDDKQMRQLLKGVYLDMIDLGLGGLAVEADPFEILKYYHAEVQAQQLPPEQCRGQLHTDPIGFFVAEEEFYNDLETDLTHLAKCTRFANQYLPSFRTLDVNLGFLLEQGYSPTQQIAITLGAVSEYLLLLGRQGVEPAITRQHIQVSCAVGSSYFVEIAKIRALRYLLDKVFEGYGVPIGTQAIPIHATTVAANIAPTDTHTNLIRATTQAMSAVISGADSLLIVPPDAWSEHPADQTNRLVRNIHHILRYESHLDKVLDPATGAYYIESLTKQIAEVAWQKFQKLEITGGLLAYLQANE